MKKVQSGIVFSNDIYRIMQGVNALDFNYVKNGLIIPTENQIEVLRDNFRKDVNRIFNRDVTIFSEEDMDSFLSEALSDSMDSPIVSLDKIYYRGNNNSYFLDCTRLDGSNKMVSRMEPNKSGIVESQIQSISEDLKAHGESEIFLVDDVVFSGNVLKNITRSFATNGISVTGIRSAISTEESYEYFNHYLRDGLRCGCILSKSVIDQICERDFYFGIAQSGISFLDNTGVILKAPYFYPYGDPVSRASIPKEYAKFFSNGCIMRSMFLWKCIEENSERIISIKDLPECIVNTNQNDRVINVLRKGLMYHEKDSNRNYGECR